MRRRIAFSIRDQEPGGLSRLLRERVYRVAESSGAIPLWQRLRAGRLSNDQRHVQPLVSSSTITAVPCHGERLRHDGFPAICRSYRLVETRSVGEWLHEWSYNRDAKA
jgi:hypothetical protein